LKIRATHSSHQCANGRRFDRLVSCLLSGLKVCKMLAFYE
jgi:hypothetical protein